MNKEFFRVFVEFLFLISVSSIFSMERSDSLSLAHGTGIVMPSAAAAASSSSSSDLFASPEEKDELCARALCTVYPIGYDEVGDQLKVYLERVIAQKSAPDNDDLSESNVAVLRRLRSGDIQDHHEQYVKRLVMQATADAFKDHKEQIEHQKKKSDAKLSKTATAIIALLSSVVTSITGVLIAVYSKK